MSPEPFDPIQAKARVQNASHGRKYIAYATNYARCHADLRRAVQASDELPALDRAAMAAVERGVS